VISRIMVASLPSPDRTVWPADLLTRFIPPGPWIFVRFLRDKEVALDRDLYHHWHHGKRDPSNTW
jgi:hypothetical protein